MIKLLTLVNIWPRLTEEVCSLSHGNSGKLQDQPGIYSLHLYAYRLMSTGMRATAKNTFLRMPERKGKKKQQSGVRAVESWLAAENRAWWLCSPEQRAEESEQRAGTLRDVCGRASAWLAWEMSLDYNTGRDVERCRLRVTCGNVY